MATVQKVKTAKSILSYKNLVHAIAGATGSTVAITAFYPLDVARTRLQVDDNQKAEYSVVVIKEILNKEGLEGLYRGWLPVVTSVCCSNFVYFYVFSGLKVFAYGSGTKPNPSQDLLLAFLAGVANVVITTPLWVANTRLKLQGVKWKTDEEKGVGSGSQKRTVVGHHNHVRSNNHHATNYKGMIDAMYSIAHKEGLSSLWSSTLPSLVLASNPAVQFMVYESLKRNLQRAAAKNELSGFVYFLMGAIAKMVATFVTYPVQVAQARLRSGQGKEGMFECIRNIVRSHGWLGLYKGLEAKLTQTVAMAALMFLTYEKIAALVFSIMRQKYKHPKSAIGV